MRTLRARLALGVGLVLAATLWIFGSLVSQYAARNGRAAVDDRLRRTAELSRATAVDAVQEARPDGDRRLDAVLNATRSSLRLFVGDVEVLGAGRRTLTGRPGVAGLRTVTVRGERYRVYVTSLTGAGLGDLARLEVTASLADVDRRQDELDGRLLRFGLVALLLGGAATYLATVRLLLPLRRLRLAAREVEAEEDLGVRVPEKGSAEVRGLAASFNAMLARLETSAETRERALEATRRFAADAGHELRTPLTATRATLSALHRHPDVPAEQRTAMLADALEEQERLVELLDGLQALARGDAATPDQEEVDLGELVALVVAETRGRFPQTAFAADLPDAPVLIRGWPAGLRLLAGNLVANAARHGRGTVRVTLEAAGPVLVVDDDGDGVPEADRTRVFEPFARLDSAAERPGSGLGLALVAQQARVHAATVEVGDAPGGGARFTVRFAQPRA